MWGVWCRNDNYWLLEDSNGYGIGAILVFENYSDACYRAYKHYGFNSYKELLDSEFAEVKPFGWNY